MFAICCKYFTAQVSFHFASESPIIILFDIVPQVTATLFIIFQFLYSSFCIISINQSSHSSTISSIISRNFSFKLWNFSVQLQYFFNCFRFPLYSLSSCYCCHPCCCSVAKSCPALCDPMDYSTAALSVPHCLLEFGQIHILYLLIITMK